VKYLCVDNDEAGRNFTALIKNDYSDIKVILPDRKVKDWNEQLENIKIKLSQSTLTVDGWKNEIEAERKNNILSKTVYEHSERLCEIEKYKE